MKKILFMSLCFSLLIVTSCNNNPSSSLNSIEQERQILDKIQNAIYMADYPVKQGDVVTNDLDLPTSYNGVVITWEAKNYPDIIDSDGTLHRPTECWLDSRDQQGEVKYPNINYNWPVILEATFEYQGRTDTHKLLVLVKPMDGFTCDKYLG